MIKCGIVGLGKMGQIRLSSIKKNPYTVAVGFFDTDESKREDFGLLSFPTFEGLLDSGVDAIFVCGYVSNLAEYTIKALKRGKHVFCEKPPAVSAKEVQDVISAHRKSDAVLKYGFNHRYHRSVIRARDLLKKGSIGKINFIRAIYGKAGSIDYEESWRNYRKYSGGGILIDQGIHLIDLLWFFLEEGMVCDHAYISTRHWDIECEDNAMIHLRSNSGIIASIHSSATQWDHKFLMEIYGEKGAIKLDGILSSTMSYAPESLVYIINPLLEADTNIGHPAQTIEFFDLDDSWDMELDEFVSAVKNKVPVANGTADDALKVMTLIEEIYSFEQ